MLRTWIRIDGSSCSIRRRTKCSTSAAAQPRMVAALSRTVRPTSAQDCTWSASEAPLVKTCPSRLRRWSPGTAPSSVAKEASNAAATILPRRQPTSASMAGLCIGWPTPVSSHSGGLPTVEARPTRRHRPSLSHGAQAEPPAPSTFLRTLPSLPGSHARVPGLRTRFIRRLIPSPRSLPVLCGRGDRSRPSSRLHQAERAGRLTLIAALRKRLA